MNTKDERQCRLVMIIYWPCCDNKWRDFLSIRAKGNHYYRTAVSLAGFMLSCLGPVTVLVQLHALVIEAGTVKPTLISLAILISLVNNLALYPVAMWLLQYNKSGSSMIILYLLHVWTRIIVYWLLHVHDYDLPIENVCEFCIRLTHKNSYSYLEVFY